MFAWPGAATLIFLDKMAPQSHRRGFKESTPTVLNRVPPTSYNIVQTPSYSVKQWRLCLSRCGESGPPASWGEGING